MRYPHVAEMLYGQPWCILPEKFDIITAAFERIRAGERITDPEVRAHIEAAGRRDPGGLRNAGAVAVIPITGTIAQRGGALQDVSGGTSTEAVAGMLSQALADPGVSSILLDVSSPGGGTYGVQELAQQIYDARGSKPICAIANSMAASAAYWIACAADELVVTPGGEVGSIGAYMIYQDISRALDVEGVTTTIISAGKYKAEATGLTPLTDDATASLQERVDEVYDQFVSMVSKCRGVPVAQVRDGMGQGRLVSARNAVAQGMADRVATFDATVTRLSGRSRAAARARADHANRARAFAFLNLA